MIGRGGGVVVAAAVAAVLTVLPATPASAATTCSFDAATHVLSVGGDPDVGTNLAATASAMVVNHISANGSSAVDCTGPDATPVNTDKVVVNHADADATTLSVNHPSAFTPGFTPETLGGSEIEIEADLGTGLDVFHLADAGLTATNNWVLGTLGVNWNPAALFDDRDITLSGIDTYDIAPNEGENTFSAQASPATGEPVTGPVTYAGGNAVDDVTGGDGPDEIIGDFGADVLRGVGGDDILNGASPVPGDKDRLLGGTGVDKLKAKDGRRDKKLDCGPGKNSEEKASRDRKKDPDPKSC